MLEVAKIKKSRILIFPILFIPTILTISITTFSFFRFFIFSDNKESVPGIFYFVFFIIFLIGLIWFYVFSLRFPLSFEVYEEGALIVTTLFGKLKVIGKGKLNMSPKMNYHKRYVFRTNIGTTFFWSGNYENEELIKKYVSK